ncbi:PAS domain-containing protein [Sulfitobacter aestuariivivens]|uniref:PAS domain-containing protein n=1 Tax=Sulfitobacter aestuariivivens TaxID=2766981 RepID=A0A927D1F2_9RHOB|nr:PAS domain-containing protein [Sulfitobacter aestuariivivens]MBD3663259.1 PAS domain-containing protein [Sulfitobacter aestuariivivens]
MDKSSQKAQNIISMTDFRPDPGFAAVSQVEAYWEALRAGRLLPKRSDINPRGIEKALENAFILERVAAGVARLRVAGSHLNDLMGMEVRGMPLTTFFAPDQRRRVADALEEMFQTPATCALSLHAPAASGRPEITGKLILLPLKSDLGDVSRALGCLVTQGDIGRTPRRFEIETQHFNPLVPGHAPVTLPPQLPPSRVSDPAAPDRNPGFADAAHRFDGSGAKKRPPYLRLIKSDD